MTVEPDLLGLKDGELVLDAGCGDGRHSRGAYRRRGCSVYAMDVDEKCLKMARFWLDAAEQMGTGNGSWHVLKADITHLPFQDASFSKVVCSEVLEHVDDDHQGVRELARVLQGDGVLAVSVPTYLTEAVYWKLSKDYSHPGGHIRKYKTREIVGLLKENNFEIYAIRYKHALHSIYWLLRCLCGLNNEKALIPSLYHKLLMWNIDDNHWFLTLVESFLNHLFPKSIVIYTVKRIPCAILVKDVGRDLIRSPGRFKQQPALEGVEE